MVCVWGHGTWLCFWLLCSVLVITNGVPPGLFDILFFFQQLVAVLSYHKIKNIVFIKNQKAIIKYKSVIMYINVDMIGCDWY